MLDELHIRDLGVIDEASLQLSPGLNVLTGETGAGKTMVVAALELLRGGRAGAHQVRSGASAAVVEARLHPAPEAAAAWVEAPDDDLVVVREVAAPDGDGARSRARLGTRMAPVSALADVIGEVIELHAQQEPTRLTNPATQRLLLDGFGGDRVAEALAEYRACFSAWQEARQALAALEERERERARELDHLQAELGEIDAVGPEPGEEEQLDATLRRLEHAELLVQSARSAAHAMTRDGGARDALGTAVAALREVAGVDPALDGLRERVETTAAEAQDVGLELVGYADDVSLDPQALEELRQRRAALGRLFRKYGLDTHQVRAYAEDARARVLRLQDDDQRATMLSQQIDELDRRLAQAAARLRTGRAGAADALAEATHAHLRELAMAEARLEITIEPVTPGPDGADRVTMLLAANPGEPALPLSKAASGGERSRVALALRLALATADDTDVLVFDEVDAGIGGSVARAVGHKLAALARGRQVLCVTHLAQLAAYADAHFLVTKTTEGGRTRASVRQLDGAERVEELGRMLSGAADSHVAARHAAELLEVARGSSSGS